MSKFKNIPVPNPDYHRDLQEPARISIELCFRTIVQEATADKVKCPSKELFEELNEFIFETKQIYGVRINKFAVRFKRSVLKEIETKGGFKGLRLEVFNTLLLKR